jgi:hypothetical protein
MSGMTSLVPLTPLVVGLAMSYFMSLRNQKAMSFETAVGATYAGAPKVFMYPQGIVKAIFVCAILLPIVFLLLPDSVVLDARPMFNVAAIVFGAMLLFAWAYLYKYRIVATHDEIRCGAFRSSSIDLRKVTAIR